MEHEGGAYSIAIIGGEIAFFPSRNEWSIAMPLEYFNKLGIIAERSNQIDRAQYDKYSVKRGLRNSDGTGVLVGLTNVSAVIGYEKIDEDAIPIEGRLCYRGIDIYDLVSGFEGENRFGFEETVYLLLFGKLPNKDELSRFSHVLGDLRHLPLNFPRDVLQTFRTPDITNALARSVLTLYGSDNNPDDLSVSNQIRQSLDLIAKLNTMVPYAYYSIMHAFFNKSLIIHKPDESLSSAENFLHLLRADSKYSELEARTFDVLLVLHADHGGGNNSTFTTRVVSSTNTDLYSVIAAGLGSLKGPLHGGANVRTLKMMNHLKDKIGKHPSTDVLRNYLFNILKGEEFDKEGIIYGIGHAVFTKSDPRTQILRRYTKKLAAEKGREKDLDLYLQVEEEAPKVLSEYKNRSDLVVSANVDFYSGFVFDCLGIPIEVYTPVFAMARIAGWCAHRIEMMSNESKIMRPAFKALGSKREYTSITMRS